MKYILPGPPKVSFWLLVFWFLLYTLALLTKTIVIPLYSSIHPQECSGMGLKRIENVLQI